MTAIDDARGLLALQRAAHRQDGAPDAVTRRDRLNRLETLVTDHADAFAAAISEDFGNRSATETALFETVGAINAIRHARRHLARWMKPERRAVGRNFWPGKAYLRHEPLGVIGIVSPWNYPLLLALSPLVDAIAAGNRAILKPSEATPRFSALLATAVAAHFAPAEVAVVTGGPDVGAAFAALDWDHLLFTGSTAIGRKVARAAAEGLVPLTLELGGKSPAIICPSASFAKSATAIAWGKFVNAGQTCIAPDYVLAPASEFRSIAEAIIAEVRRFYPDLGADYSSLISARAFDRLDGQVREAVAAGAIAIAHGASADRAARRYPPTIIVAPSIDIALMQEEIFGPVLPIIAYDDLDEALAFVADRPHPLALYCFAKRQAEIDHVLSRSQSGGVTVNGTLVHIGQESLPFGGVGASGMGGYHGRAGFDRLTHARGVFRAGWINPLKLLFPPYGKRARRMIGLLMR
jgi:coniferyl-aldehyde dehydrogenase